MMKKKSLLDEHVAMSVCQTLGPVVERTMQSSMSPFHVLPDYKTMYPEIVVHALGELYAEYNRAFTSLVEANREWSTDYKHGVASDGSPVNFAVQIDMVGLPQTFLDMAVDLPVAVVREVLRGRIFEIENSLAMYQFLECIFANDSEESFFKSRFQASLRCLRHRFGKKIALLAVTDEKHVAMRESEFGKKDKELLSDAEVFELSGFDKFFGPVEFREYTTSNRGECDYLLYIRSSDPIAKIKDPGFQVEHPLLGDPEMRKIIKAHALTFSVDAPEMLSAERINDTKEYMLNMGMVFPINSEADLFSPEFAVHLVAEKPYKAFTGTSRLSHQFATYLVEQEGVDPWAVESGTAALRCKPVKGTYGCYGHVSGVLTDGKFRGKLRRYLRQRSGYIVQPEMRIPHITNTTDGAEYMYIDRNFFTIADERPKFLGGFRSLMPAQSTEAKEGRIHGNNDTVWAEIISSD